MKLYRPRHKTAHRSLQGLFPLICSIPAHTIQKPHEPPMYRLRHAGGHTVKCCTSTNTQIPPTRRTLYRSAQPPYYNKVYKGSFLSWTHARQRSESQTMPARRLVIWHRSAVRAHRLAHSTRRGSPAAGGAEPLAAYRRFSFRAFAR